METRPNIFTVYPAEGVFNSFSEAVKGWIDQGCPKRKGSSVWVTEDAFDGSAYVTVGRTVTLERA